ncbi:ankyrin repeat and SOCS box protein 10-like isoform X2 [Amphibalanus amphitrite]|uniref:ankyrin repeat and SOCS box protein 10-like isoform X2 n=1 Tax=Amphibalanus amphitrite TaxID=1232801 RepID=UPI001C90D110|nr:ankyrin repeat and SOCS box protein 10-like isoform X2 [Amphibalanus amphitrite]
MAATDRLSITNDTEELACSMLERSADPADGDSHGPLLPAACFLGECQHRLSSLQRQLDAPPLNRKAAEASLESPLSLLLGYSTVLHKPATCAHIEDSVTSLHRACATADPRPSVRDLCRRHPQLVNVQNGSGQTPLHVLFLYQSRGPSWPVLDECVTSLLEAGARLDAADQEGDTPLLYLRSFVTQGHHELAARLAERLAAAGADVNAVNGRDSTLLMYAAQQLDAAASLTRALLNAGAEVRVRRASAFCALLRGVVQRRRLEDCDTTLALLCRQMARRPAEMQRHVLGAMVSQGQHIRLLGPVFLELKSRIRRYWSQPAELRHLCCEEVRRNLQQGGGIAAGVHRLAVPPALQRCITLEDIS